MRVIIVGCGIIGAAIAYELSALHALSLQVLDRRSPAQGATGAALGVLMGVISQKVKGRNWRLREASLQRYRTLIPELETQLDRSISYNRQGILNLCFELAELPRWQSLRTIRRNQGYRLEIWSPEHLRQRCPDIATENLAAAIYSPDDGQVDPSDLTWALVDAARQRGVTFNFEADVQGISAQGERLMALQTPQATIPADIVIIAAGLGSLPLTQSLHHPVTIGPVLGQAVRLHLDPPANDSDFQPVITGNDIHLVPLGGSCYWVGATVEFPDHQVGDHASAPKPLAESLEAMLQGAIAFCPMLVNAALTQTWHGLRPRPQGQAAPIIKPLEPYRNVLLATGHYRNGVLLAPATALAIKQHILEMLE